MADNGKNKEKKQKRRIRVTKLIKFMEIPPKAHFTKLVSRLPSHITFCSAVKNISMDIEHLILSFGRELNELELEVDVQKELVNILYRKRQEG